MIITRTPFRISFLGGGTDFPAFYNENGGGAVLQTTIDKYCYISCRYLPPFFAHKTRVIYSQIENVTDHNSIKHPAVRGVLGHLGIHEGVEIHHDADLPAQTGLGSSSSFTVGLLLALYGLQGKIISKHELARTAIHVEQCLLRENVGCQDQIAAAFGGFNKIEIRPDGEFHIHPITLLPARLEELNDHLMLVYTGISRISSEVAAEHVQNISRKTAELSALYQMVDEGIQILRSNQEIGEFGRLLHEAWQLKRSLSSRVSTSMIDTAYETARDAGAIGGKILGSGGGGFLLFFVRPEQQKKVRERLGNLLTVPFEFEQGGSQIVFYSPAKTKTQQAGAS